MADRYWVGGTASWDGTAGTKWAATSGGPGGETLPTSADDVFFDANSTGTTTIAIGNTGAKSITCTGFTGTITGTGNISVVGSVTLAPGMTYSHIGVVTFTGTGTLTTAGKSFGSVSVNGTLASIALGDALSCPARTISVLAGTFNTNNYSVSCGTFNTSTSAARTVALGSSTLTVTAGSSAAFGASSTTGLTFSAGTSLLVVSGAGGGIDAGNLTFNDISYTSTSASARYFSITSCNNLTFAAGTGACPLSVGRSVTINGTLSCTGTAVSTRGFIRSSTIGSSVTITAAAVSVNDCDFRDITLAGAAAGASPVRAGDCGGNSGIIFPAPKTVYRVGSSTTFTATNAWALTSGGAGSDSNFPLAQDTIVIDNGATPGSSLTAASSYNLGTLDCSNRTNAITLSFAGSAIWYGSIIFSPATTISGGTGQAFSGRGTQLFTSAGNIVPFAITIDTPGGTFRLQDALSSSSSITLVRGGLDASVYSVTITALSANYTGARTLIMGSGLWTLTGTGTVWSLGAASLTFDKGTANMLCSDASATSRLFDGGAQSYNKLTIGGPTGTSTFTISGGNSFTELSSTKTVAHTVTFSGSPATIGTWSITGTSGNVVTVNSSTAGTRRTFTLSNITSGIDYLSVKDIGCNHPDRFYVGANSTDGGNNSNVIFTAPPTVAAAGAMFMLF